ncbi:recombinase family protein [Ruminococcus sp.]|uniref:recombinase family protein n=1 Tax=Ruminococcus sp. TaxID=41978 RepID=UPI003F054734
MQTTIDTSAEKRVTYIAPNLNLQTLANNSYRQLRVAAYCRVSTRIDEQLNSYEVQKKYYTDKINSEPKWTLVGIFADKGITGTSALKRDEFQKMIRMCKKNKIDMIITKSISRFSRNTVDCLTYVRLLKSLGVDVFFEEQGLHSKDAGAEFYITIYGSIAQSESENISANVRWGKDHSAKEGNVSFHYKNFLGYKKGADGKPEIDKEEAITVKRIYNSYLSGDSLGYIAKSLENDNIKSPAGKDNWTTGTIRSILTNEKYIGDALLNKTYVEDCISKKVKKNNGVRPKYYVENNHPAIIDKETFNRVQEEIARRVGKRKIKQVGTKTELGKYSSKYALTELLICGECGTPYRRCTWTYKGKKRVVWRCINRLDYGKKYCKHSPTMDEKALQNAIVETVMENAAKNSNLLDSLKQHISMGLSLEDKEDKSIDIQIQIARLNEEYNYLLSKLTADTDNSEDIENQMVKVITKKHSFEQELERYKQQLEKNQKLSSRLDQIFLILETLKNHPLKFDDKIIRQIIDCVIVESKEKIKVVFVGGDQVENWIE